MKFQLPHSRCSYGEYSHETSKHGVGCRYSILQTNEKKIIFNFIKQVLVLFFHKYSTINESTSTTRIIFIANLGSKPHNFSIYMKSLTTPICMHNSNFRIESITVDNSKPIFSSLHKNFIYYLANGPYISSDTFLNRKTFIHSLSTVLKI